MTEHATELDKPFPWLRPVFDPPELYEFLRKEQPITKVTTGGGDPAWLITRYDDVRAILADPHVTSDPRDKPLFPYYTPEKIGPTDSQIHFFHLDDPEHQKYRRMIGKFFLAKQIAELRPAVQKLVDETIDAMLAGPDRPVDLVEALALPVPSIIISWLLGVPPEDRTFFNEAALWAARSEDPNYPTERCLQGQKDLEDYVDRLAATREVLDDPGDDILGCLVSAAREGKISRQSLLNTTLLVLSGGHETSANMIALGTMVLLQNPDQMAELRQNPELMPNAVDELLRYLTIAHLTIRRVATADIELGGQLIRAGDGIIPLNLSANRDDAHYPDPDTFDIHRQARDHFAFGYGIHQCIGQGLARMELEIVFNTLLQRIPTLSLVDPIDDTPRRALASVYGVDSLRVTW